MSELKTRTASGLWAAQQKHLGVYKAEGLNMHKIFFDREGGIGKLQAQLMNNEYRLQEVGAGTHVPRLEVKLRGILNTLVYNLPESLLPSAAYFVVVRLNSMPAHT